MIKENINEEKKMNSMNTILLTTAYTCFWKDCPRFILPSCKNKMFYTSYKQKINIE